jgi:protein TorT
MQTGTPEQRDSQGRVIAMFRNAVAVCGLAAAFGLATTVFAEAAEWSGKQWWPVKVMDKKAGTDIDYVPLEKASKKWHICVLFPHMKDLYWKAVDFGVMDEAARLGVKASLFEAGGYENLPKQ